MEKTKFGVMIIAAEKAEAKTTNDTPGVFGPKALWPILDKPAIGYLLKTILECDPNGVSVVVERENSSLREYLGTFPSVTPIAHASPEYHKWLGGFSNVLALEGVLPFLRAETVRSFMRGHIDSGAECSSLGDVPHALIFNTARIIKINGNAQCLSGLASMLTTDGLKIQKAALDYQETSIFNQADLAKTSARMRDTIVLQWMEKGVRVMDPHAVWIGPDAKLEPGVSLMPGAQIWGNSFVGEGSVVGPYCILRNATLGKGVKLVSNVIVEDSKLDDYAQAGPFAYIRESSVLKERSFAGKFVEIKKTTIGIGSKVPHLSYMGDAFLGEDVNIGAGSITCNYDGASKHQTKIGDRCFVGCDTMMVAPVTLSNNSITAAGSTITTDVPPGALAVARARQKNLEGWAEKRRKKQTESQ